MKRDRVRVKTVLVTLKTSDLEAQHLPAFPTYRAINALRQQGVPVIGRFGFRGVRHGRLSIFTEGDNTVYEWTGVPDNPGEAHDDLI